MQCQYSDYLFYLGLQHVRVLGKRIIGYCPLSIDSVGDVSLLAQYAPLSRHPKPKRLPRQKPKPASDIILSTIVYSDEDSSDEDPENLLADDALVDSSDDDEMWYPPAV